MQHLTAPKVTLTRQQRQDAGRALRTKCSRKSHETWRPQSNRPDPISVLIRTNQGRIPHLLPIRYGRMMESPFAFYRGAAAIMAGDLAHTPKSSIIVQACGDCHLSNFGLFATPERRLIFDISDFDETAPAPWEWDLKRLAASFVIAAQHIRFSKRDARDVAERVARSYRLHMSDFSGMRVLERWYERLDADELIDQMRSRKWKKLVRKRIAKETARTAVEHDFPKLAHMRDGRARIKDNPPLIFHPTGAGTKEYDQMIRSAFRRYCATLADDRRALLEHFAIQDVALKVVGVGSVGTYCAILLMMAGEDDPLFLQVKEARSSVLEPHAGKSVYRNRGQRVVNGQRLMQAASDLFLGWTTTGSGRHFYVRQLRDVKISPVIEIMAPKSMDTFAEACGWALARAHAKSGDSSMIAGYLGTSGRFDEAVARFAVAYAQQNERDHEALLTAIRSGRVPIARES
jgi:uncharacterized protein (DUF2252 family)